MIGKIAASSSDRLLCDQAFQPEVLAVGPNCQLPVKALTPPYVGDTVAAGLIGHRT
ncbi:hypothetical protein FHS85_001477 [Rhodoligotrophos appendicifer]|uniref:hypothetical protein n=1 Tax=Rhodoligotrophos appendicifer TaxID=987056 RepID=UPI0014781A4A|nr:hypothetical protein [Rhodoligotrophos appendicifer]